MLARVACIGSFFVGLWLGSVGCGGGSASQSPASPTGPTEASAPDPVVVCEKMTSLASEEIKAQGGTPKNEDEALKGCVADMKRMKSTSSAAVYTCHADCVMRAQHGSELDPCWTACPQK
jgi:hypothetical protein